MQDSHATGYPLQLSNTDRLLLAVITVTGTLAPLRHFTSDRSLWGDEAALAENLVTRNAAALFGPLDHDQIAPIGFLMVTKAIMWLFGSADEHALRLLPLAGALTAGPAVYVTALIVRGRFTAVLATLLTVLAPSLIYYASEAKPYATDAAATAVLLLLAVRCLEQIASNRRVIEFAAAACILATLSFPAVLTTASALAVIALARLRQDPSSLRVVAAAAMPWAVAAAATLWLAQPSAQTDSYMQTFWSDAFITFPPGGPWELSASLHIVAQAFNTVLVGQAQLLVLPLGMLMLGLWLPAPLGYRLKFEYAALLALPWIAACLASRLHFYPLGGRLTLFLLPTITIGAASTLCGLADDRARSPRSLLGAALVAVLLLNAAMVVRYSIEREEFAGVIRDAASAWRPGDRVYVYYGGRHAFAYYNRRVDAPWDMALVHGQEHRGEPGRYVDEIEHAAQGDTAIWILFSHVRTQAGARDEKTEILEGLSGRWAVARRIERTGASAVLLRRH